MKQTEETTARELDATGSVVLRGYLAIRFVSAGHTTSDLALKAITTLSLLRRAITYAGGMRPTRLLRWTLDDCLVEVRFRGIHYSYYCAKGHDYNIFMNPYLHEYDIASFAASLLRPGDGCVDVGAHGGLYTLLSSELVGDAGWVVSVEPNPENLKYLRFNIALNKARNVEVVPMAVGSSSGEMTLRYSVGDTAITSATSSGEMVLHSQVTTLDELARRSLIPSPVKLLKVDTEGMDLEVLHGADEVLRSTMYVIVEQNSAAVVRFLEGRQFIVRRLLPSGYLVGRNRTVSDRR